MIFQLVKLEYLVVLSQEKNHLQFLLLLHDRSHDITHPSEIAIFDSRRVYGRILRGVELRYGR